MKEPRSAMHSVVLAAITLCLCANSWLSTTAQGADSVATGTLTSQIVTHNLTPVQLQEDFGRLRFTLEHVHPALYRYATKDEIVAQLDTVQRQLNRPMTDLDFYRLLSPLIAMIRNSHTSIQPPSDAVRSMRAFDHVFPFVLRYRDGRAYVETNLTADTSIRPGMEMTELNGRSMAEWTKFLGARRNMEGFVESTEYERLDQFFWLDLMLQQGPSPRFVLIVRDLASGALSQHEVTGVPAVTVAGHVREMPAPAGPTQSIMIDQSGRIASMRLKNFLEPDTDTFFRSAFHQIAESGASNLIIDLRGNHGGIDWFNSDLLSYLSDQPFRFYRERTMTATSYKDLKYLTYTLDDFLDPGQIAKLPTDVRAHPFDRWTLRQLMDFNLTTDRAGGVQVPKTIDHFHGRVYLLIDGLSGSSAAEVPALMHHLGLATIIGEEPNGSYQGETAGVIPNLVLPNSKLVIRVPLLAYWNDVMPGVRAGRGAEPTFTVSETLEDAISGVDTVMNFTRALIRARAPAKAQTPDTVAP